MMAFVKRLGRALRREDGTATIEFVLTVPLLLTIFMASFESGLLMTRAIMLERAVDITMRDLRLGRLDAKYVTSPTDKITIADLRKEMCPYTVIFANCETALLIELQAVDPATWSMPQNQTTCVNRNVNVDPVTTFNVGTANEIMLVRVCVVLNALFPTSGLALRLSPDSKGGYGIVTASAFVNEP